MIDRVIDSRGFDSFEWRFMAIVAAISVTMLERIDDSVEVTAVCTPPTSFDMRDCRSPVRADA